nr:hypothetical protein Itr_chr13CG16770 [Ipomoea trifida]
MGMQASITPSEIALQRLDKQKEQEECCSSESATSSSTGVEVEAAPGSSFVVGKGGGGDRREDAESSHGRQALWSAGAEVEIGQQLYCWNSTSRLSSSSRKEEERGGPSLIHFVLLPEVVAQRDNGAELTGRTEKDGGRACAAVALRHCRTEGRSPLIVLRQGYPHAGWDEGSLVLCRRLATSRFCHGCHVMPTGRRDDVVAAPCSVKLSSTGEGRQGCRSPHCGYHPSMSLWPRVTREAEAEAEKMEGRSPLIVLRQGYPHAGWDEGSLVLCRRLATSRFCHGCHVMPTGRRDDVVAAPCSVKLPSMGEGRQGCRSPHCGYHPSMSLWPRVTREAEAEAEKMEGRCRL